MKQSKNVYLLIFFILTSACGSVAPPPSQFPDARSAITQLDATYAQVSGLRGQGKIDFLGEKGRIRGDVSVLASTPSNLRFALTTQVIGVAGEVASNGTTFQADDKSRGRYLTGPAKPCNIARLTQVSLPSHVLVPLLWGMRPPIEHPITCNSIRWSEEGYYIAMLRSEASTLAHELHIAPTLDDWNKPYQQQRVRLVGMNGWSVSQHHEPHLLFMVSMKDHQRTKTALPLADEDGLNPLILPSGPVVEVEIPHKIKIEVPDKKSDVIFQYSEAFLNPPLAAGVFQLKFQPNAPVQNVDCE